MLGVNQSDFMSYMSALKSNYRKGVHRMEAILSNPTMSAEFAANLGGVSVVLGVPISMPDRNSDKLLELLLGSAVADNAVETWLHQFYEFTDWDDLLSDSARCQEMANNPLIWRAAGGSKLAVGKSVATLAGLSCAAYKDIDAVAASQVAMAAVASSRNATALNAVVTSVASQVAIAMAAVIETPLHSMPCDLFGCYDIRGCRCNSGCYGGRDRQRHCTQCRGNLFGCYDVRGCLSGCYGGRGQPDCAQCRCNLSGCYGGYQIAGSKWLLIWRSDTAIKALQANATAWKTFTGASSAVMGKTVAILANLDLSGMLT